MEQKVTTPQEMEADTSLLDEAIRQFELKLLDPKNPKGLLVYRLEIPGIYNQTVRTKVGEAYKTAGWKSAICLPSDDVMSRNWTFLHLTR